MYFTSYWATREMHVYRIQHARPGKIDKPDTILYNTFNFVRNNDDCNIIVAYFQLYQIPNLNYTNSICPLHCRPVYSIQFYKYNEVFTLMSTFLQQLSSKQSWGLLLTMYYHSIYEGQQDPGLIIFLETLPSCRLKGLRNPFPWKSPEWPTDAAPWPFRW